MKIRLNMLESIVKSLIYIFLLNSRLLFFFLLIYYIINILWISIEVFFLKLLKRRMQTNGVKYCIKT